MISLFYFSPTGNVEYLAQELKKLLKDRVSDFSPLEFLEPHSIKQNNHLVIMFSIHAFNPPRTVLRFVKNLPSDRFNTVSLIAVGCTDNWVNKAVFSELTKILLKKNYKVNFSEVLNMPLTFILSFPKKLSINLIKNATYKLKEISKNIEKESIDSLEIPFKSRIVHTIGKLERPAARLFGLELHANKNCTSCGICVKNCPEQNIYFNKKKSPRFKFKCLMCMRCIYNCPEKAISPRFSKFIPIKNGYKIDMYLNDT